MDKIKSSEIQSNAQLALRFCLSFSEISTTIPGMLNKQHVLENALSSNLGGFKKQIIEEFKKIYNQKNFFIK